MSHTIRIDASWLPRSYSTKQKDGLYAEFYENGQLAHVGWYRNGEAYPGAWLLYLEKDGRSARVERTIRMEQSADSAQPQATVMERHPYRARSAESPEYAQWVAGMIEQIAACADENVKWCSFCQLSVARVAVLITGPGVNICGECVQLCSDILAEQWRSKKRWWQVF